MNRYNLLGISISSAIAQSIHNDYGAFSNTMSNSPDNSTAHKQLSTEIIAPKAKRNRAQWKREQKVLKKGR